MGKQWLTIFLGSKITADGDCSQEIKRHLLLGRKVMLLCRFSHVRLFCDPVDYSPPGSSVHGTSQRGSLPQTRRGLTLLSQLCMKQNCIHLCTTCAGVCKFGMQHSAKNAPCPDMCLPNRTAAPPAQHQGHPAEVSLDGAYPAVWTAGWPDLPPPRMGRRNSSLRFLSPHCFSNSH